MMREKANFNWYLESRLRLSGHILCLPCETLAIKSMRFYLQRSEKGFRVRPEATIVTAMNKDINRAK